ncbi:hypothetical protein L6452_01752 [Arctium lappa]|uniref:Uncharacterized protein n=1 Tax=Arctium lappa TaxID=4217 RepID=A0ACB9FHI3_ARCLA|nr:hypothetical protein L6452_01752 [Arctium lappa]
MEKRIWLELMLLEEVNAAGTKLMLLEEINAAEHDMNKSLMLLVQNYYCQKTSMLILLSITTASRINTASRKVNAAGTKLMLLEEINAAEHDRDSHGRITAEWTEDYGKLGDNDGRYSEDILLIIENQPQGIDPNSREVEFVLKSLFFKIEVECVIL